MAALLLAEAPSAAYPTVPGTTPTAVPTRKSRSDTALTPAP